MQINLMLGPNGQMVTVGFIYPMYDAEVGEVSQRQYENGKALAEYMYHNCQMGFMQDFLECYNHLRKYGTSHEKENDNQN